MSQNLAPVKSRKIKDVDLPPQAKWNGNTDAFLRPPHMVRRVIPDPVHLEKDLTVVYELFKGVKDPETQQPFFRAGHAKRFDAQSSACAGVRVGTR